MCGGNDGRKNLPFRGIRVFRGRRVVFRGGREVNRGCDADGGGYASRLAAEEIWGGGGG
jgi:hypothetical protein